MDPTDRADGTPALIYPASPAREAIGTVIGDRRRAGRDRNDPKRRNTAIMIIIKTFARFRTDAIGFRSGPVENPKRDGQTVPEKRRFPANFVYSGASVYTREYMFTLSPRYRISNISFTIFFESRHPLAHLGPFVRSVVVIRHPAYAS